MKEHKKSHEKEPRTKEPQLAARHEEGQHGHVSPIQVKQPTSVSHRPTQQQDWPTNPQNLKSNGGFTPLSFGGFVKHQ
jgi:hypothetical protein